jgi:hypothetical protein
MRTLTAALALALSTTMPSFAMAASPGDTGLPGTKWAMDCSQPASSSNYHLAYSINKDDNLVETLIGGDKPQNRPLRNVQIISPTWMLYTMDDTDGDKVDILTKTDEQGRKKSWWSVAKHGQAFIVDGKFPGGGEPPWFSRCK